jgi:hypothetical protein
MACRDPSELCWRLATSMGNHITAKCLLCNRGLVSEGTGLGKATQWGCEALKAASCELRAAADKDLMISAVPCWWSQRDSREKHSSMPPSPPLGTFRSTAAADLSALSAECSGSVCLNSARPNSCSILVVGLVTSAAVGQ